LLLKKLYTLVSHFLKRVGLNSQAKEKERPQNTRMLWSPPFGKKSIRCLCCSITMLRALVHF